MPRSSTSPSEPLGAPLPAGSSGFRAWLAGVVLVLGILPVALRVAFSAHEPNCAEAEAFWLGDLPTGEGRVDGVVLGSSQMGLDIDVHALAEATGHPWVRVARHAVEPSSIPRSYPRMLASTPASPGLAALVVEVSPLLFDRVGCARPALTGLPIRLSWWSAARRMLGPDAELAPDVAMGWLPHRQLFQAGRRRDLVDHLTDPSEALALLRDLPRVRDGFAPPARWEGEPVPELTAERVERRRRFLFGGDLAAYEPVPSAACLDVLARTIDAADAGRTVLLLPPLRRMLRDAVPEVLRQDLRAEVDRLAAARPGRVTVLDATDAFADGEAEAFTDFDHLSAAGARRLTARVAAALESGTPD